MQNLYRGDFLGFILNGYHSSAFGIFRNSTSDRYHKSLVAPFQDQYHEGTNNTDNHYFNTFYKAGEISINFAFQGLNDETLLAMKKWLNETKNAELVFDETPYKCFIVSRTKPIELNVVYFEDGNNRYCNGTGTIFLTNHYSFAIGKLADIEETDCNWKAEESGEMNYLTQGANQNPEQYKESNFAKIILEQDALTDILLDAQSYEDKTIHWFEKNDKLLSSIEIGDQEIILNNKEQWLEGSGLTQRTWFYFEESVWKKELINNCDTSVPLEIVVPIKKILSEQAEQIQENIHIKLCDKQGQLLEELKIDISIDDLRNDDEYLLIDSYEHLIWGLNKQQVRTENIYNRYIIQGDFFEVPVGDHIFQSNFLPNAVNYDYLYFC